MALYDYFQPLVFKKGERVRWGGLLGTIEAVYEDGSYVVRLDYHAAKENDTDTVLAPWWRLQKEELRDMETRKVQKYT